MYSKYYDINTTCYYLAASCEHRKPHWCRPTNRKRSGHARLNCT